MVEGISINETLPLAGRRRDRDEDAADAEGQGAGGVGNARCLPGTARASTSPTDRGSEFQRLAYMDLATKKVDVPDAGHGGRGGLRPVARREDDRLRRPTRRASSVLHAHRHATPHGEAGPEAAVRRRIGGVELAPGRRRHRLHDGDRALERGRLLVRAVTTRQGRALDLQRDGRPERRTTFAEPELVTWKSFDGREIAGSCTGPTATKFPGKRRSSSTSTAAPRGRRGRASSAAGQLPRSTSSASR